MKKIPYGITNFKELVEQNCYYVDKTMYISDLERAGNVLVYLRPRRFGKTLFTSMISYYYDIASSDMFDELFKDTYVYDSPTTNKNNYYILKFDFSGISTFDTNIEVLESKFKEKVLDGIDSFISKYDLDIELNYTQSAEGIFSELIRKVQYKLENKIYIIIDEYDNFTNALLGGQNQVFKNILGKDGFVKAFYARIKESTGSIVGKVFITGVCGVSLDSMTSGFNIATNISTDFRFNSMTALTHDEVKKLISDMELENSDELFNIMLENYDGYKFSRKDVELVFNPTLTMYYLNNYYQYNEAPEDLLDSNIISSYEQIRNIIKLSDDYKDILDNIFDDGEVISGLVTNYEFNENHKFSKEETISLLYYFGYLTIKKVFELDYEKYVFMIPNKVIEKIYEDYYLSIMREYNIVSDNEKEREVVIDIRDNGNIGLLCEYISNLLKNADNRLYINFKEKDLQLLMYLLLSKYKVFETYMEYPSGDGYIDLMILKNELSNYDVMIELKYIKKSEEALFESKKEEALEQLKRYSLNDRDNNHLKKYAIIFIGSEYKLYEV